ncbi:MAG: phosphate signaling complex protein PhoU [Paludibacter sp.]|jgi:phosphate transport system protein|nr:phosphate signaling complex protein PhoU [Paludibacter sp.]
MRHLEQELVTLRQDVIDMWKIVISQVYNAGESILSFDKDLAMKVSMREKKVDAYELKIDSFCENIIALHQPVAIDLRFVLAALKINSNLERIADFAYGISRILLENPSVILDAEVITDSNLRGMIEQVNKMLQQGLESFENENSDFASAIFSEDSKVDEINAQAVHLVAAYIQKNPDRAFECLQLISAFRKLERIGDHCSNIAEEIFFFIDAKVLKHSEKK